MSLRSVSFDLPALQHNFQRVKHFAPHSKIAAVIKSNAYGHGLLRIAKALPEADAFAVFSLEEAYELRKNNITQKIVVLSGFDSENEISAFEELDLIAIIHKSAQIEMLKSISLKNRLDIKIKIDVGMHRLGFLMSEFDEVVKALSSVENVNVIGILSHLPCADRINNTDTKIQLKILHELIKQYKLNASVAHSPAVIAWPESHYDWVRPGIMLFGISPIIGESADKYNLRPVMTLRSKLISIRNLAAGECIGYGATWICPEAMRIGVVSIGYGSGYPRHAVCGTPVLVSGKRCPLIGRVCMDMISVDLRDHHDAQVDDPVVLWGEGLAVEEIANCSDTIAYELVSGVSL